MKKYLFIALAVIAAAASCGRNVRGDHPAVVTVSGVVVRGGTENVYTNGNLESGYLVSDAVIGGLPLRGGYYIKLDESGKPLSGFLSAAAPVAGTTLPEGAGFLLSSDGKLIGLKPVAPAVYSGLAFTNEWVFFHPNGRVSAGFLMNAYTNAANGAVAGTGEECGFYESGKLRFCTLAGQASFGGATLPAGSVVEFYESGLPKAVTLRQNAKIGGILYQGLPGDPDRSVVEFFETGRVETGFLGEPAKVNGMLFKQNTRITFYRSGGLKSGTLAQNTSLSGRLYLSGTEVMFSEDGNIATAN